MQKLIHTILNVIFPEKCLGCKTSGQGLLCQKCLDKIPRSFSDPDGILSATSYHHLATPLPSALGNGVAKQSLIQKSIWLLKYKRIKSIAEPLAELIYTRFFSSLKYKHSVFKLSADLIIPIPLSKKKLRQRGFNQAELIAKHLSDKTLILTDNKILQKIKHTESQVKAKTRENRLKNLKGTFKISTSQVVRDKTIILVDDVSTTGATILEASRVLKKAGAKKIIPIVVAKS